MSENIFTLQEQKEIIKIFKGILLYAVKNPNNSSIENLLLEELILSCNDVLNIIRDKEIN